MIRCLGGMFCYVLRVLSRRWGGNEHFLVYCLKSHQRSSRFTEEKTVKGRRSDRHLNCGTIAPHSSQHCYISKTFLFPSLLNEQHKIIHPFLLSGRRLLCLLFCLTYTATCTLLLVPSFPLLLLGRILGGISTSILFSAFESWVVSSSATMGLGSDELSKIMGRATLVNGFVAAAAGVCTYLRLLPPSFSLVYFYA